MKWATKHGPVVVVFVAVVVVVVGSAGEALVIRLVQMLSNSHAK